MKLGAFTVSLNVKDINKSKDFYEMLGFKVIKGNIADRFLFMKNDHCIIALFQGIFHENTFSFYLNLDETMERSKSFTEISKLRKLFKKKEVKILFDPKTFDPDAKSILIADPDGNTIHFEQLD